MKILFLTDAPSPHSRRWIEAFRDYGYQIHVISFRDYQITGVDVEVLSNYGLGKFGFLFNVPKIKKLIKKINPDIIHAHHITSYGFLAALSGVKNLIVTAWGSDVLIVPKSSYIWKRITMFALSQAKVVTTVSEFMTEIVIKLGVAPNRVRTINFGVDVRHFKRTNIKKIDHEKFTIICTRNFSPIYDIPTFIRALAVLKDKNIQFNAVLIGDGPLKSEIKDQIDKLGLNQFVVLKGHCDYKELPVFLSVCDVFVTSSLSDGNNVSLTEAMACGCFPIGSDIPANRQWINDGQNGFLFPVGDHNTLADKIEEAFHNPSLISNSIDVNRKIIMEKANWEKSFNLMNDLYLENI